jgi:hypothetical protein
VPQCLQPIQCTIWTAEREVRRREADISKGSQHPLARTIAKSEAIPREKQGLCSVLTHLGCP